MLNEDIENIISEECDFDCFSYELPDKNIEKSFSFSKDFIINEKIENINYNEKEKTYGATPLIDGESFNIKRSYQLRASTLKKLQELKLLHPNVNVHLNTLIDNAINLLYSYIKNGGNF